MRLSIKTLCLTLKNINIEDLRYSQELGIAKFYLEGKRIRLDEDGNISISDIKDEQEAKIWVKRVKAIIQKAFC